MSQITDCAKSLLAQGTPCVRGCSEFVCKVLGIPWEHANDLMGANPVQVGTNGNYHNLSAGDIVGWIKPGDHGHVAVYIGEPGTIFIDVQDDGLAPRSLSSYGPQPLFKSSRF